MSRRPLMLHVGMHKTGTTAIQTSLAANRTWLRSKDIHYPELQSGLPGPKNAHHGIAHALAKPTLRRHVQLFRFRRGIERAAPEMRMTVLSAEPIYRHSLGTEPHDKTAFLHGHRAYLERLAHYLRGFEVLVLLYLRRPDTFVVSRYKERVTSGHETPEFPVFSQLRPWLIASPERMTIFRDVFGALEIRNYDTERAAGLVPRFYAALGLSVPPVEPSPEVRVSPSNRATLWLRRAQRESPRAHRGHRLRVMFATSTAGAGVFSEQSASTLWPSDEAFTAFVTKHCDAYESGGFALPDPPGCPQTVWTDAMHSEAQQAFAAWEAAGGTGSAEGAQRMLTDYVG